MNLSRKLASVAVAVALVAVPSAAQAAPQHVVKGGCDITSTWHVQTKGVWYGNKLSYTGVDSPKAIETGGAGGHPESLSIASNPGDSADIVILESRGNNPPYSYIGEHHVDATQVTLVIYGYVSGQGYLNCISKLKR